MRETGECQGEGRNHVKVVNRPTACTRELPMSPYGATQDGQIDGQALQPDWPAVIPVSNSNDPFEPRRDEGAGKGEIGLPQCERAKLAPQGRLPEASPALASRAPSAATQTSTSCAKAGLTAPAKPRGRRKRTKLLTGAS